MVLAAQNLVASLDAGTEDILLRIEHEYGRAVLSDSYNKLGKVVTLLRR